MSIEQPDYAAAQRFLDFLGRDTFEFRCIGDSKALKTKGVGSKRYVGKFENLRGELTRLNDAGWGIYVQVNQSNGSGFKAANIIKAPCHFADLDGVPLENIQRLAIRPHMVIETSEGKWHAYWRIADLPADKFKSVQQRIARLIESDQVVVDLPRVMRMPGFNHMKGDPRLVTIVEENGGEAYSQAEFELALEQGEAAFCPPQPASNPVGTSPTAASIKRSESALRHLVGAGKLDIGTYADWIRVAFALKHTHSESGWALFHSLSAEASGYEGEAACRAKWDGISEAPDGQPLTMGTFIALATESGWRPPAGDDADDVMGSSKKKKEPDPAAVVLQMVREAGDELWLDRHGTAHVSFDEETPAGKVIRRHAPVDSGLYRQLLQHRFYVGLRQMRVLAAQQEERAVNLLTQQAMLSGERHPAHIRVAPYEGDICIDLGREDGLAIRCTADGWELIEKAPVRFVKSSRGELPVPAAGGSFDLFRKHFNLDEAGIVLAVAAGIACLTQLPVYPICMIVGGQGTAKSTMADMLVALTDPPNEDKGARFSLSTDERNLHVQASRCRVLMFDNVSVLTGDEADALCRVVTGAASSYRRNYSNRDEETFAIHAPVLMTCISPPTARGDFLSRGILLRALPVTRRRLEEEVRDAFAADRAQLFGFLLDCICMALANRASTRDALWSNNIDLPRLADFALTMEACRDLIGYELGDFCRLLGGDQAELQTEATLAEPFVAELVRYLTPPGPDSVDWTAAELLEKLSPEFRPARWPKAANGIGPILRRHQEGLLGLGISVEAHKPKGKANVVRYRISRVDAELTASLGLAPRRSLPF